MVYLVKSKQTNPDFSLQHQTQFCLNQNVWDADLGKTATGDTSTEGWKQATRKSSSVSKRSTAPTPRTTAPTIRTTVPTVRKISKAKEPPRPLDEWFPGEDRENPISNAVAIPVEEMNRIWKSKSSPRRDACPAEAKVAMVKVHNAMRKLRACYTDAAVEKASLEIAAAFLGMLSIPNACENPFLCLQQAAIFASHGTKRGNSDDIFRGRLPAMSECTPQKALVILGRADCFQAVHFPYEAAYLCSYIAKVCSLHRQSGDGPTGTNGDHKGDSSDRDSDEDATSKMDHCLRWDDQWMVVSTLCYNISIMIRTTVRKTLAGNQQTKKEEFDPWDQEVVDEFLMGRSDALAWKNALSKGVSFTVETQQDAAHPHHQRNKPWHPDHRQNHNRPRVSRGY